MDPSLNLLLKDFAGASSNASEKELKKVEGNCKIKLPKDYRAFLMEMNGGEGFIGEEYLILWKADELEEFNREYQVQEYAPGLFLFASTGGGEGFAFDLRERPYAIVQVPFIGMDLDSAKKVADNFLDLLERMYQSDGSLL